MAHIINHNIANEELVSTDKVHSTYQNVEDINAQPRFKRSLQQVLTNSQRANIVKWMQIHFNANGAKGLCTATVKEFPTFFRGSDKANLQRASRYWRDRATILARHVPNTKNNGNYFIRATRVGIKSHAVKAGNGRGRRTTAWCSALSNALLLEFDRLRKARVKMNSRLLRIVAHKLIDSSENSSFAACVLDPKTSKTIKMHVTKRWIQHFMQRNDIVSRTQSGKLMVSPAKQELIEREVAFNLGELKRQLDSSTFDDVEICNAAETHFVIDQHDQRTLSKRVCSDVKYADVVSADDGMTMMVLISGSASSSVLPPFMIFKNDQRSYPIRNVPDNIPGVSYISQSKTWMDREVFLQWLKERRAIPLVPPGKKLFFIDNCGGHALSEDVKQILRETRAEIRFFSPNATHLCQPADSFAIQKIKTAWRGRWDAKKLDMIEKRMWLEPRQGFGKLANPGKPFFLKLACESVRDDNAQRGKQGLLYARKAMIGCGLAKSENGVWEEKQLFKKLQDIIERYRENFDGSPVDLTKDLEGERTESERED